MIFIVSIIFIIISIIIIIVIVIVVAVIFPDHTENGGTTINTWKFVKSWKKITGSTYSEEHGWRLKVSTTYSSGLLSDAIAKWQVNVEGEGHGKYITTNTEEEIIDTVYERLFKVMFAVILLF